MNKQDPNKQQHHTYGDSKAAKSLYKMVQELGDIKTQRAVGRRLMDLGTLLNDLDSSKSSHQLAAHLFRQRSKASMAATKAPDLIKTHTQNVMDTMYKKWLRGD